MVYTLCLAHLCLSGAPEDDVNGDPFLSFEGVRFSTHLRKVLVAPNVPMEDQDSEEYRYWVLTNSMASFTDGTAIVSGRDKNQVAGLELKETMILCGRAAQTTHIKSIAVFFHPMEQIEVASGKFNMVTTEAEFTRLESELSFLQVRSTMTLQRDDSPGESGDMRGPEADWAYEAGEHCRGGESLQPDAGLRERTLGHPQRCDGVRDAVPGG